MKFNRFYTLLFLISTSSWPANLLVSPKVGVIFGLNRILMSLSNILLFIIFHAVLIFSSLYFKFYNNEYFVNHFLALSFFLIVSYIFIDIIDKNLSDFLMFLKVWMPLHLFFLLLVVFFSLDLSSYRGLNSIYDDDGVFVRVFFESCYLIYTVPLFIYKNRLLSTILEILRIFVAIFIIKSLFLLLVLLCCYWIYSAYRRTILFSAILTVPIFLLWYIQYRGDLILSVFTKLQQFKILWDYPVNLFGSGLGFFDDRLINDIDQPYQIEMQLPMLLVQLGIFQFSLLFFVIALLFFRRGISLNSISGFIIYMLSGFTNPWMFVPIWFLSCYMFTIKKSKYSLARN